MLRAIVRVCVSCVLALVARAENQAYAGLSLRDNPEGTVVGRVMPGPLQGDGMRSPTLWRGDLIVSVNEQKVDAAGFAKLIAALKPGDELRLVYRRRADAEAHLGDAVPSGDPDGEERTTTIKLASRDEWTGTMGRPLRGDVTVAETREGEFEARILAAADKAGIRSPSDGVDALLAYLKRVQDANFDANSNPFVVRALRRPLSLDATEKDLAELVRAFARAATTSDGTWPAVRDLVRGVIDGRAPGASDVVDAAALDLLRADIAASSTTWRPAARALVASHRDNYSIPPQIAQDGLALVRASPELASKALALGAALLARVPDAERELATTAPGVPPDLKERVAAAVAGAVSAAFEQGGRLCVVGGSGKNVYDMSKLARVFDRGGDDVYRWSGSFDGDEQLVIDLAGNDRYESSADFAGPGVALFGLSIVDDRGGNDVYATQRMFAQACGLFGLGLVIDRKGDDRYENTSADAGFAQGVGYWGAGLLIDLAGKDTYTGEKLAQGVGGPRGLGALIDVAGNDVYKANGPSFASVYDTPGVFVGMSQGMGYGMRGDAAGGVGALFDLAGNDRYDVGEFGQGCGYYFALGVIHDVAGDDEWLGQRYAQGTGAHQAAGILVDEAGDDSYRCKEVAFQGGAWDQTVAWLVDRRGDDVYTGFGLGQGAAAQQALGVLVDCAGKDTYTSQSAQGESSGNDYHYDADKLYSFSVLLDLGGKRDEYSSGRANDAVTTTGARNATQAAASNLYGLCIDD